MAEFMKAPLLFPCANRVKMPHVGADETVLKQQSPTAITLDPLPRAKTLPNGVSKSYVKQISSGLSFSEDVVRDRCFHTLPYSDKYFLDALDVSDLIAPQPKSKILVGRHDARGSDKRHMPCHIQKRASHKLKPVKHKVPDRTSNKGRERQTKGSPEMAVDPVFLTEAASAATESALTAGDVTTAQEWDKYLLSILSQNTAEWIVKQRTSPGRQQSLEAFVEGRYGPIAEDEPELVKDNISEVDFEVGNEGSSGKWKKGDETMLDKVREITLAKGLSTDPYNDDNQAAFYRLPAGVRRAKKHQDKEEAGAINTTAYAIDVVPYQAPPPTTLRDHMNPAVGSHMYDTDNHFIQEWLKGSKQIHKNDDDPSTIVLDNNNKYRKVYVEECPRHPDAWYPVTDGDDTERCGNTIKQQERGLHRWRALPELIDDTAEKFHVQPPGVDTVLENAVNNKMQKQSRNNNLLLQIVDDWRQKWHLDMRYADASPDDLVRDMADIHPHIQLKAITTCARAAEYRPPPELGIQLDTSLTQRDHVKLLPEVLFTALELCLEDGSEQVRQAAAVALYTLERPIPKAEVILRSTLQDENSVDRWTAAQCLAYYGECDSDVVSELISQLLRTEDPVKHAQAATLLARLSENSTLVHSMIGEQLNSSSWRHRIMACQVLPKLHGHINKDLVNKLMHLMWTDWHTDARKIAAQTLGKTGHGKRVHDELRDKIINSNERSRVEAISRIGQLGIMTAKLLPVFLQCFEDSYVSVRMEVCVACSNLGIHDDQVLDKLVHTVTYDPVWKVKALAIQALGEIGHVTKSVRECVLWAFRYEDKPGVRVEACHTIIKVKLMEPEVAQILQDRYLVEKSELVKREIVQALDMFGISPSADMDMVTQIKQEVNKLCTRNNICAQITLNEQDGAKEANVQRMIYQPPGSAKKERETPRYRPISRKLTKLTSSDSINKPPGSSRPLSRPFSHDTTATDREIMAICDRYDDNSSVYTDKDTAESGTRTGTGHSEGLDHAQFGHPGVVSTPAEIMSLPKSRVTFASPEAGYQEITDDEEDTARENSLGNATSQEITPRETNFGDAQTYVEVAEDQFVPDEFSADVVQMEHEQTPSRLSGDSQEDNADQQTTVDVPGNQDNSGSLPDTVEHIEGELEPQETSHIGSTDKLEADIQPQETNQNTAPRESDDSSQSADAQDVPNPDVTTIVSEQRTEVHLEENPGIESTGKELRNETDEMDEEQLKSPSRPEGTVEPAVDLTNTNEVNEETASATDQLSGDDPNKSDSSQEQLTDKQNDTGLDDMTSTSPGTH